MKTESWLYAARCGTCNKVVGICTSGIDTRNRNKFFADAINSGGSVKKESQKQTIDEFLRDKCSCTPAPPSQGESA